MATKAEQEARRAKIVELYGEGWRDEEIAEVVGGTAHSIKAIRLRFGLRHGRWGPGNAMDFEFVEREFQESGAKTDEEIARTIRYIATQVDRSPDRIRGYLRKAGILTRPRRYAVKPPEVWDRAKDLLDQGLPYSLVAKEVGTSATYLAEKFPGQGLGPSDIPVYVAAKRMEEGMRL